MCQRLRGPSVPGGLVCQKLRGPSVPGGLVCQRLRGPCVFLSGGLVCLSLCKYPKYNFRVYVHKIQIQSEKCIYIHPRVFIHTLGCL